MYCQRSVHPSQVTVDEVRQMSFKVPGKEFRHPTSWMPTYTAIETLNELLNCQIEYLFTDWDHAADLPMFRGCLVMDEHGEISYDF
ncbi:hypothetical protein DPMN_107867 [Dreissena polymorpha]|uniref:Uncharacterized protein n=1 Tax=Dreissena polymorpha TaxID=45954 RepID=A0A9D4QKA9_DREPO|nr:hypothetical protein DPMN_107867 [Dreissena polymorpha]